MKLIPRWQNQNLICHFCGTKLIPNWQDQNLTCHFCGTNKNVKYKLNVITINTPLTKIEREVCACDNCVPTFKALAEAIPYK